VGVDQRGPGSDAKLEHFFFDGQFDGATTIYARDGERLAREPEPWLRRQFSRFWYPDTAFLTELLRYLIDVRQGVVDPAVVPPPCPPGGRVSRVRPGEFPVCRCGCGLSECCPSLEEE